MILILHWCSGQHAGLPTRWSWVWICYVVESVTGSAHSHLNAHSLWLHCEWLLFVKSSASDPLSSVKSIGDIKEDYKNLHFILGCVPYVLCEDAGWSSVFLNCMYSVCVERHRGENCIGFEEPNKCSVYECLHNFSYTAQEANGSIVHWIFLTCPDFRIGWIYAWYQADTRPVCQL